VLKRATIASVVVGASLLLGFAPGAAGTTSLAAGGSVTLSAPPDVVVGEADGQVSLLVRLSAASTSVVSVAYATANSTAYSGTGCNAWYVSVSGTLNFAPGETSKPVPVEINDCGHSGFGSFTFNLSSSVNGSIARASTRVSILGDGNVSDSPGVYVRDAVVDNRAGKVSVPVLLGGPSGAASLSTVTVAYATQDGSAIAGTDYTEKSGTLTFSPGETVKNVVVQITNRAGAAPTRSFGVSVSGPVNAHVADGTGVVTIGASGAPAVASPLLSAPADLVLGEADGYVDLPVRLSAPGTGTVSVAYATANSSAYSGNGCNAWFVGVSGTINFAPGETSKAVRIEINDCGHTGFGSFTFNLSSSVNGSIARASTRVLILGDGKVSDSPGVYVRDAVVDNRIGTVSVPVLLGGSSGAASLSAVTVAYSTHDGSAAAGTDYTSTSGTLTFSPGETVKNVVVPITDRPGAAPTRSFSLSVSGPVNAHVADGTGVVTIGASGAPAVASPPLTAPADLVVGETDGYIDLPVRLSAPGTGTVSVAYTTANSSAYSGTGCDAWYVGVSGTINFAPGETSKAVRIELNDCGHNGIASFVFSLSSPVNATLADANTRILMVGDGNLSDSPVLYVRDAVVDTRAGFVSVPVLLGAPLGTASLSTVTVAYSTHSGSAVGGTDYTPTSGKLTFSPWETVKNVVVPITNRPGSAPDRSFSVSVSGPVNAQIADGTGIVTIGASGAPAVASPALSAPADLVVGEADGYVDLPVRLSAPGTSTVSVAYATANSTAYGGNGCDAAFVGVSGTLDFAPGETSKAVRVDLNDCGLPDPGSFKFNLSSPVNASIFRATTTLSVVQNPQVPGAPPGVHATAGNKTATVSFAAPASDGGDPINSYTVTASPGGAQASGLGSPIRITNLTNGTAYTFRVKAVNSQGTGTASPVSNSVVPSAIPDAPTATKARSGSTTTATGTLIVTFTIGADNGSAITGQTARCTSSNGGATETGTHSGASAAPITVALVTTGKTYTCAVTAVNGRGPSTASVSSAPVVVGAPAAPTSVVATRMSSGVLKVTFTPGANNGSATTSYAASCSSTNGGAAGTMSGSASPVTVSGLTAGKSYHCDVAATNARGTGPVSSFSAVVTA
jgi:hypothetical protein